MDRFKFRVFDKRYSKYHYGAEMTFEENKVLGIDYFGQYLDDDDFVVEQCTGLKDKNGKLIYEGDICIPAKDMADKAGEVYRAESGAYFIKGRMKSGMEYDFGIYWHHYMYEIIGNIHENPELLEDK